MISGTEKNILFDTGADADDLLNNMKAVGVSPAIFDIIFISHHHKDHTNGLLSVLDANKRAVVLIPEGFADFELLRQIQARGTRVVTIKQAGQICGGVFSTGPMQGHGLYEQALILNTRP